MQQASSMFLSSFGNDLSVSALPIDFSNEKWPKQLNRMSNSDGLHEMLKREL